MGRGDGEHVGAERGAEELLEPLGCERRGLRQEREDPATVVVDDDDAQVGACAPTARRARCSRGRRRDRRSARPTVAASQRPTESGRHAPRRSRWRPGSRAPVPSAHRTTRDHGSASTTRPSASRRPAGGSRSSGPPPGSVSSVDAVERLDRSCAGRSRQPRAIPPATPGPATGPPRRPARRRSSRRPRRCVPGRSPRGHRPGRPETPTDALHWASTFELAGRPIRTITSGRVRRRRTTRTAGSRRRRRRRRGARAVPRSDRRGSAIRSARATSTTSPR